MGRPLSKKFIGNRNIGTTGTSDNYGIGGEGVASVTANTEGSYTTALPTASFSAPNIPTGVTTTGIVHGKALSAATTSNGTGYNFGDTLTVVGGTSTSAATFTVASTVVVAAVKSAGGSGYADGDVLTFSTGFSPTLTLRVNRPGGGTGSPDNFTITQAGRRTSANPTNPVSADSRTGSGSGCTVTLTFGVYSFSTVVIQGDYTVIPSSPVSFTGGGTGTAATVPFGVSGIVITEKGSGYTSVADAAITFSGGAASYTPVLTTDSGNVGSGTNQENAIQITAWVPATGTAGNISGNGTSAVAGDIIRQCGNGKYIVRTAQGVGRVKLVAGTPAVGEATIIATDSAGGNYYVTKISDRRCNIVKGNQSGTQFTTGTGGINVSWTFNGTSGTKVLAEQPYLTANVNVKISNA
jgi:membrane-bound inhibitor of C-type lysozyme